MTLSDYLKECNIPEDSAEANYILQGYMFATRKAELAEAQFIKGIVWYRTLAFRVKEMREAQKKFGGEVDVCVGFEEGLDEMWHLEDEVDEMLKDFEA